jgi:beta-N-acetylhexosaminidase
MNKKNYTYSSCFMLGIKGKSVSADEKVLIKTFQPAGVILFKRNIASVRQLIRLINELKSLSSQPLLIGVDHEGGRVFRLSKPFTSLPSARVVAMQAEKAGRGFVKRVAHTVAGQIKRVGFNLNFAPILDVDSEPHNPIIGDRAFSEDPQVVARLAAEYIQGLQGAGVIACGKHFPGHGDTTSDSHLDLPILTMSRAMLNHRELIPFQKAICQKVATLMPAHVLYTHLDANNPATLSSKILSTLLRKRLGFKGVVISDDLCMEGVARLGMLEDLAVESFRVGVDVPLICQSLPQHGEVLEHFCQTVSRDQRLQKRWQESQRRIGHLRRRFRLNRRKIAPLKGPLPGQLIL